MGHILIVEPDDLSAERVVEAAPSSVEVQRVDTLAQAQSEIAAGEPLVVVTGPSLPPPDVLEFAVRLSRAGMTSTVMLARSFDAELLKGALRAGVADVIAADDPITELSSAIERAAEIAAERRAGAGESDAPPAEKGKVVTVFSTKGGVGKTVLATNLSVALARDTGKRVALIDLDLEFGDVAIMLGIRPEHTIYDAVQVFDRLDADMLAGFMEQHSSGVSALLAPLRPEDAESISAARVGQVIDLVRAAYDYVVIDTSPSFSEAVLTALDRSDELFVVTMMDVASIKNTRISLQKLKQLGYDNGRLRLVLNRSDSKVLLQTSEVESAIGGPISACIPSDRVVPRSVNKGVPIVLEMPKSEVAKSILKIAHDAAQPRTEADYVA